MDDTNFRKTPESIPTALYTLLALVFSFLWASAFIAIKFGLRSSPPFFLMGFRFLVAGSTLLVFAHIRGHQLPDSRRDWLRLAFLGLMNNAAYLGLSAVALRHLSGGMAAVLASTNPLMLAAVAAFFLKERLGFMKVMGLVLSFFSVVAIMYSRFGTGDDPSSMALLLLANAFLVIGTVLFKHWSPRQNLTVINGIQLLIASVALLLPSLLWEPVASVRWNLNFLGAITYLSFAVSCGAMMIWFFLLRSGDASKASAFFFLNPVIGLFLGTLLLNEPLRLLDFVGTAGVALGIYLVQLFK
jgi:drug/metabolite transporter (DMT)-like permease